MCTLQLVKEPNVWKYFPKSLMISIFFFFYFYDHLCYLLKRCLILVSGISSCASGVLVKLWSKGMWRKDPKDFSLSESSTEWMMTGVCFSGVLLHWAFIERKHMRPMDVLIRVFCSETLPSFLERQARRSPLLFCCLSRCSVFPTRNYRKKWKHGLFSKCVCVCLVKTSSERVPFLKRVSVFGGRGW